MAMRRNVGARIGNLGEILLKQHLQQQNYGYENDLLTQRQKALSEQNATEAILKQALGSPKFAAQLNKAQPGFNSGGIGIGSFAPTGEDASGDVATAIANNPDRPYTPESIDALYHAAPGAPAHAVGEDRTPIDTLMAQKKAQDAAALARIIAQTKPEQRQSIGTAPNGEAVQQTSFVNPYQQLGQPPVQTSKTGAQEGQFKGNEELGTLTTPGLTPAKITAQNLFTRGTMASKAAEAGAVADQTTNKELKPQYDPQGNPTAPRNYNPRNGTSTPSDMGPIQASPGLGDERKVNHTAQTGIQAVDRLDSLIDQDNKMGLIGPAAGRLYDAYEKLGTTQGLPGGSAAADDLIGQTMGAIVFAKGHVDAGIGGARAASSPLFLAQWKSLATSRSPEILHGLTKQMKADMSASMYAPHGATPAAAAPAGTPKRIRYDAQGNPLPN